MECPECKLAGFYQPLIGKGECANHLCKYYSKEHAEAQGCSAPTVPGSTESRGDRMRSLVTSWLSGASPNVSPGGSGQELDLGDEEDFPEPDTEPLPKAKLLSVGNDSGDISSLRQFGRTKLSVRTYSGDIGGRAKQLWLDLYAVGLLSREEFARELGFEESASTQESKGHEDRNEEDLPQSQPSEDSLRSIDGELAGAVVKISQATDFATKETSPESWDAYTANELLEVCLSLRAKLRNLEGILGQAGQFPHTPQSEPQRPSKWRKFEDMYQRDMVPGLYELANPSMTVEISESRVTLPSGQWVEGGYPPAVLESMLSAQGYPVSSETMIRRLSCETQSHEPGQGNEQSTSSEQSPGYGNESVEFAYPTFPDNGHLMCGCVVQVKEGCTARSTTQVPAQRKVA